MISKYVIVIENTHYNQVRARWNAYSLCLFANRRLTAGVGSKKREGGEKVTPYHLVKSTKKFLARNLASLKNERRPRSRHRWFYSRSAAFIRYVSRNRFGSLSRSLFQPSLSISMPRSRFFPFSPTLPRALVSRTKIRRAASSTATTAASLPRFTDPHTPSSLVPSRCFLLLFPLPYPGAFIVHRTASVHARPAVSTLV